MLLKVILLGIIQGITEFLPVSSTAHLVLAEKFLGVSQETFGLSFDIALHLGTALALIIFFRRFWQKIIISLLTFGLKSKTDEMIANKKIFARILIALVPAVLVGYFLAGDIEKIFRSPFWIGVFLILFSFVFLLSEIVSKKTKDLKEMTIPDSLVIGLNQSIALLPGVSRSGITISGGLLLNFKREEAGKFTFLLSTPIIIGAFLKDHINILNKLNFSNSECLLFFMGMLTSFLVGLLTLKYFLRYLSKGSLLPFIIYRIILGVSILLLLPRLTG